MSFDTSKVTTMSWMFRSATAFNQPLSLDTSSVTNMQRMFYVRSARAISPQPLVGPSPRACRLRHRQPTRSPASRPASRSASHALLSPRQYANAFNQPLSFETSKVTTMRWMFYVRTARALGPQP